MAGEALDLSTQVVEAFAKEQTKKAGIQLLMARELSPKGGAKVKKRAVEKWNSWLGYLLYHNPAVTVLYEAVVVRDRKGTHVSVKAEFDKDSGLEKAGGDK